MRRLDHLKTVYMSGFQCYRAQVEAAVWHSGEGRGA
uniref:Uncharacterized protein n=1 Tax=Arundo donax TaxID=35708 RepID=A0A0A8ZYY9_ARUDO